MRKLCCPSRTLCKPKALNSSSPKSSALLTMTISNFRSISWASSIATKVTLQSATHPARSGWIKRSRLTLRFLTISIIVSRTRPFQKCLPESKDKSRRLSTYKTTTTTATCWSKRFQTSVNAQCQKAFLTDRVVGISRWRQMPQLCWGTSSQNSILT